MDISVPAAAAAAAKSLQSRPTLCDLTDGSPPGSPVLGILQARILEWVAISFSNAWKWKVKVKCSVVSDSVRPHRQQPTRLLRPWDSPGKSTGVGCHFLLQCIKVKSESEVLSRARLLAIPWTAAYQAPPSMGFSGKSQGDLNIFLLWLHPQIAPIFEGLDVMERHTKLLKNICTIVFVG